MLVIKEVKGNHSGENIAKYVIKVIKDYKIKKQLSYFVIDNANNNDTLMATLLLIL